MSYKALVNEGAASLLPYHMGKPIELIKKELELDNLVRLNLGECSLGVSKKVKAVLEQYAHKVAFYPDSNAFFFKERLYKLYGYKLNHIAVGAGSSELISLLCRAFLNPQVNVIIPQLSSLFLERSVQLSGAKIITTPIMDNWCADLNAIVDNINGQTRMILLSNPTNPIGAFNVQSDIVNLLQYIPQDIIVVINEELIDYLGDGIKDNYALINQFPNLVLCRSLSHARGLAGLRVGYMLSNEEISGIINTLREPYNVSQLALDCAEAALKDNTFYRKVLKAAQVERQRYQDFCNFYDLSFINTVTNSITIDFGNRAERFYQALLSMGIFTRPLTYLGLPSLINITLSNPYQTDFVLQKIEHLILGEARCP